MENTQVESGAGLRERASRGVMWSLLQTFGSRAISTVLFICLARLLAPTAFGLVALASVFVSLMQVFVDQGFGQAIVQRHQLDPEHLDSALWSSLAIGLVLTGLTLVAARPVADILHEHALAPVLAALSPALVISSVSSTPEAILQRDLAFGRLAARQLLATTGGAVIGIGCAIAGLGVWSLVAQTLGQALVAAAVLWVAVPWRPRLVFSWPHFLDLFRFGSSAVGVNLLNFVNRRTDDLLIGVVLGPRLLGLYSVAYRLLLLITDVMTKTIDTVAFPVFSRVQKDKQRLKRGYLAASSLSTAVAAPVFGGIIALAPIIIAALFGSKWSAAAPVMQILACMGILQAVMWFNITVIMAAGKARVVLAIRVVSASLNVAGFAIAVHWGIVAVAASYVVCGYLVTPLPLIVLRRIIHLPLRELARVLVGSLVAAAITACVLLVLRLYVLVHAPPIISLLWLSLVGTAVYVACLAIFARELGGDLWGMARSTLSSRRPPQPRIGGSVEESHA